MNTPKASRFHSIRLGTKATLIASLLIFGHVLLTTSANAPIPIHLISELPASLSTISALIFLTLLWITFSLIESCDLQSRPLDAQKDTEKGMVFNEPWVEGLCQLAVLGFWLDYWQDAQVVLEAFSQHLSGEFVLLPLTYYITISSIAILNMHLAFSIMFYAFRNGLSSVNQQFWCGRTGWWAGNVQLNESAEDVMEAGGIEKV
ncbi:uncharacterized protein L201_000835 [Kwoniella dendrophila CBS 6074]|uniref:Uncharacterized protein n=1 Tax=Kwoniella dendrophila CBS 6074 TaxID=1295534 RepID=A0AAX4JN57_9TREE